MTAELEWHIRHRNKRYICADADIGGDCYFIEIKSSKTNGRFLAFLSRSKLGRLDLGAHTSIAEAKAACSTHHAEAHSTRPLAEA